ncbi:MAG: thioredoxin family protein [Desulfotignum sp.]
MKKENILVIVLVAMAFAGVFWYFAGPVTQQNPFKAGDTDSGEPIPAPAAPVTGNADLVTDNTQETPGIDWKEYTPGLGMAKKQDKNIFLYFYAQWCTYCTKLKKTTFLDQKVLDYLEKNFISISVDTDHDQALAQTWQVKGLPTMWFLTPEGNKINSLPGYVDGAQLFQILRYIHTKSYDTMSFQEFLKQ